MTQVCTGVRVLEFSRGMAGALAGMVLADNGAEVIVVEPPGGDPFRANPAYRQWHRGKQSVVLDLATAEGRRDVLRLAATVDVVLENFRPGVAERLGIDYDTLSQANPGLVYCAITGFGENGPYARYKGYDAVVQAKTGRTLEFNGELERDGPIYPAVPVASFGASQLALQGIFAALLVRDQTGRGQRLHTSLLQGASCYDAFTWMSGQLHQRMPSEFPAPTLSMSASHHYLVAPTADGYWLQFAHTSTHLFHAFARAIGLEEVFAATGVFESTGLAASVPITQELWELLLVTIQERTLAEWLEVFDADTNISAERFLHAHEAYAHPQVAHNGHVIELDDPQVGQTRQVGPLVRFTETPSAIEAPAPAPGADTDELLATVRAGGNGKARTEATGPLPKHPLEGVTVLELAGFYAAPYGTSLLADLGARVIKIEPLTGDPMRSAHGAVKTVQGKESLALNLASPEGREVFHQLVKGADALMHNYRPGVPQRLGMDYDTVRAINPSIVYLYAASYGSTGPYAAKPAFHPTFGANAGGALRQAGEGVPPPPGTPLSLEETRRLSVHLAMANEMNPDPTGAMVVGTGLMAGLLARERTGKGQYLETTMLCSNLYANSDHVLDYEGRPPRALPDGDVHGLGALYRLYRCRTGWIFLACPAQREWEALCAELGLGELTTDARFATPDARTAHDAELATLLGDVFLKQDAASWEQSLSGADLGCVVADAGRPYEFFLSDPQIEANGWVVDEVHPDFGPYRRHTANVDLSLTPGVIGGAGTRVGEHTRAILAELGYSASEIEGFKDQQVVTWPDEPAPFAPRATAPADPARR